MTKMERLKYASLIHGDNRRRSDSILRKQLNYLLDTSYNITLSKRPMAVNDSVFQIKLDDSSYFMMAEKAALFEDADARARILQASSPGAVKALGRGIRNFDESVWVANRFQIVVRANVAKFDQHPELGEFLRQTGSRVLVEASPVDRIWGIGLAQGDERASDPNR